MRFEVGAAYVMGIGYAIALAALFLATRTAIAKQSPP
jgi:hypothetical protein